MRILIVSLAGLLGWAAPARAASPVAIVEDVKGKVAGVEFMDYVLPGRTIDLGANGSIVLSYLTSCWRETITGGKVTVGAHESRVESGAIERTKVDCDADSAQISDREASQSAATAFRGIREDKQPAKPMVFTIYGLSPLIESGARGKLVIERTDVPGERHEVTLPAKSMVKSRFYDFALAGKSLTAGGTYTAVLGSSRTVFKVGQKAKPGATPIVGRLLRL